MIDIGRTLFPLADPKGLALLDFSRFVVGECGGSNVGVPSIENDVAGTRFGFGHVVTVNVAECYPHGFGSAVVLRESGQKLVKNFTILRVTLFCEDANLHVSTPFIVPQCGYYKGGKCSPYCVT